MLGTSATSMAKVMWETQEALHKKNNSIVPGMLLSASVMLVAYYHIIMQEPDNQHEYTDSVKHFLCMLFLMMLPLALLELKIMSCVDPVGLFCRFAVPVTLSHIIFLTMRLLHWWSYETPQVIGSAVSLAVGLRVMVKNYHWSPSALFRHKAVWGLFLCAAFSAWFGKAIKLWAQFGLRHKQDLEDSAEVIQDPGLLEACSDMFHALVQPLFLPTTDFAAWMRFVLEDTNSYMELLAFVPAVQMVAFEDKQARRFEIEELDTRRTCTGFFVFLVVVYSVDDLYQMFAIWEISACASAACAVHYLFLLDFACYILAHIYNPEKLMGELRKWLPIDLSYDV